MEHRFRQTPKNGEIFCKGGLYSKVDQGLGCNAPQSTPTSDYNCLGHRSAKKKRFKSFVN